MAQFDADHEAQAAHLAHEDAVGQRGVQLRAQVCAARRGLLDETVVPVGADGGETRGPASRGMASQPASAATYDEAVALYEKKAPGMILADIQLADGSSGIDAVNDILKTSTVPVIFITAFPERLLTGERPEPAFLVTKPFNPDMVKALISQALFFSTPERKAA